MKKLRRRTNSRYLILITLLISTVLSGCKDTGGQDALKTGTIKICIDNTLNRAINSDDSTIASANTNKYEVLIYNNSVVLSTILDLSSSSATLSVETGVYTVLVLAGYSTSSEGVLLGSAIQELVSVEQDIITDVAITLTSISHNFTVPGSAACTEGYSISVTGDTNNQMLQISSGGTVMENRPYIEIGENTANIYLNCTVSGSSWSGTVDLTAPNLTEQTNIELYGSNVKIIDPAYSIDDDLKNIGSINWKWLNLSLIPEPLAAEVNKDIEFVTADSGIGITINWS